MDRDIKTHIMNIMKSGTGGCKHEEMSQALSCKSCGDRMIKAQGEYKRLQKLHPEKFIRKEPVEFTKKEQILGDMLTERIKKDKLYQNHLKTLATGTTEEKLKEVQRIKSGFYKKNSDY